MTSEFITPASTVDELIGQLNGQWLQFTSSTRLVTSEGWQITSTSITCGGAPLQSQDHDLMWRSITDLRLQDGVLTLTVTGSRDEAEIRVESPWGLLATMGAALAVNGSEIGVRPASGFVFATPANVARWENMPLTREIIEVLTYTDIDPLHPGEFLWPWDEDAGHSTDELTALGADLIGAVLAKGLMVVGALKGDFIPTPMPREQQIEHVLTQWMALGADHLHVGSIGFFDLTEKGAAVLAEHRAIEQQNPRTHPEKRS